MKTLANARIRSIIAAAALAATALVAGGCAAPTEEDAPEAVATTHSALTRATNCSPRSGDWLKCYNLYHERHFNLDSYALLYDVDAWGDERVEVKNAGYVPVVVYVAQGFNKTDEFRRLEPGETTILERLDPYWPVYNVLFDTDPGLGSGIAELDVRTLRPPA